MLPFYFCLKPQQKKKPYTFFFPLVYYYFHFFDYFGAKLCLRCFVMILYTYIHTLNQRCFLTLNHVVHTGCFICLFD